MEQPGTLNEVENKCYRERVLIEFNDMERGPTP